MKKHTGKVKRQYGIQRGMLSGKNYLRMLAPVFLFFLFWAAGCGKYAGPGCTGTDGAENGLKNDTNITNGIAGGSGIGGEVGGSSVRNRPVFLQDFQELSLEDPGEEWHRTLYYDTYDGKLYLLAVYEGEGRERTFSMNLYDGETGILEEVPFSLQDTEDGSILSMDVLPDGMLSFRMKNNADEAEFLVQTDLHGEIILQEDSFPDVERYPWNPESGDQRKVFDFPDSTIVSQPKKGQRTTEFFVFDSENCNRELLGTLEGESVSALCRNGENGYYCIIDEKLVRWNTKDDSRTELMTLYEKGLRSSGSGKGNNLLRNSKGEIIICDMEGDVPGMYIFSESRPQREGEVRLTRLATFGMEWVNAMATKFSRSNQECSIYVEQEKELSEQEALHDRIFLEMAVGKGPELMWVFEEDMRILNDKGLLMDLGPLIPEETRAQIFSGVLEAGTLDGKLVAIAPEVYLDTIVTSDAVWRKGTWTRKEFLNLLEKNKSKVEWPITYFPNRLDYYSLFSVLLTDYSDFMDPERGVCNFDSEEFRRILRVCKEYGRPDSVRKDKDERLEMLKNGSTLGIIDNCYSGIREFSSRMKMYGEDCHIVGYPTASGENNCYLSGFGYLAVSANAVNIDGIRDFIAYLLDYDNQYTVNYVSVRRDVLRDQVIMDENTGKFGVNLGSPRDPVICPIETRLDGSTYQEEYINLMENCVPNPVKPQAVRRILNEELSGYFEGNRSVEEVTRIIQNRVQIYLDESAQ